MNPIQCCLERAMVCNTTSLISISDEKWGFWMQSNRCQGASDVEWVGVVLRSHNSSSLKIILEFWMRDTHSPARPRSEMVASPIDPNFNPKSNYLYQKSNIIQCKTANVPKSSYSQWKQSSQGNWKVVIKWQYFVDLHHETLNMDRYLTHYVTIILHISTPRDCLTWNRY